MIFPNALSHCRLCVLSVHHGIVAVVPYYITWYKYMRLGYYDAYTRMPIATVTIYIPMLCVFFYSNAGIPCACARRMDEGKLCIIMRYKMVEIYFSFVYITRVGWGLSCAVLASGREEPTSIPDRRFHLGIVRQPEVMQLNEFGTRYTCECATVSQCGWINKFACHERKLGFYFKPESRNIIYIYGIYDNGMHLLHPNARCRWSKRVLRRQRRFILLCQKPEGKHKRTMPSD